jgi:hypothetical protein
MGGASTPHEEDTQFWLENLKERDHTQDLGVDKKIILKWY